MKNPIKTLDPNTRGRDFVIGDLHGSLSCLQNLLTGVNFDSTVDRVISVGDLVDRGPDSIGCMRLLREPWFHAVLSNHEQMMLEAFNGGYMGQYWMQNGGRWGYPAYEDHENLKALREGRVDAIEEPRPESVELFDLLTYAEDLPFLITINRPDGKKFHVLHAELPPGVFTNDSELSSPQKVLELATTSDGRNGDCFLWSRFLFGQFHGVNLSDEDKVRRTVSYKYKGGRGPFNDELSHIISGHTILQRPLTILGQTNIDTCAYGSYAIDHAKWEALTCVELGSWTFYQATASTFRTVVPLTVNSADVERT